MKTIALILAAGNSTRFGKNKLEHVLHEKRKTVLQQTVSAFQNNEKIDGIVIVCSQNQTPLICSSGDEKVTTQYCHGGKTRYESLQKGLICIQKTYSSHADAKIKVVVHNGANPFVTKQEIDEVIEKIEENTAVGVGRKIWGTVKRNLTNETTQSLPREPLWEMQTPQGAFLHSFIEWSELEKNKSDENRSEIFDELMLAEKNGGKCKIVPASKNNIKITTQADIQNFEQNNIPEKKYSTGFGIDSHRFDFEAIKENQKDCILCGVNSNYEYGFVANSDGDVALHALCNALLASIGQNSFSRIADKLCAEGITDSTKYLEKVLEIIIEKNVQISHVSLSFEGKNPKLEKHFPAFRDSLSYLLSISDQNIGLNATTGENLDGYGKGEGLKVSCVVTVYRN